MPGPVELPLGDKTLRFQLEPPDSYADRYEVWLFAANNPTRAFAAALGVCWPKDLPFPGRGPRPSLDRCNWNIGLLGGQVVDRLVAAGARVEDVLAAGLVAHTLLGDGMVSEKEVAEAEGFTGPAEGPSTG